MSVSATIINYSIALVAVCFAIYFLIQKSKAKPGLTLMGLNANTLIKIGFMIVGIFLAIIILSLLR